jgi:hypothetical protein
MKGDSADHGSPFAAAITIHIPEESTLKIKEFRQISLNMLMNLWTFRATVTWLVKTIGCTDINTINAMNLYKVPNINKNTSSTTTMDALISH